MDDSYWQGRKDLSYYRAVEQFAREYCPDGKTLLDVGGGVGLGCRYLERFSQYGRTSVEKPSNGCSLEGVQVIHDSFLEWEPQKQYDLVLCLQVLEHIPDASRFARKLFKCGPVVIVSVPYQWKAGSCRYHVHDPVDDAKLKSWTDRDPVARTVANTRLITVYE